MVARCLVGVLMLAGCDQLFGLQEVTARDAPAGEAMGACPASYDLQSRISASRYRVPPGATTWDTATTDCNDDGATTHLLVVGDESERNDVLGLLAMRDLNGTFWVGLQDRRAEDVFQWVTDEPIGIPPLRETPPWSPGEPDNYNGIQDCVSILGAGASDGGLFADGTCDSMYRFVCECDSWAPDPTNYEAAQKRGR